MSSQIKTDAFSEALKSGYIERGLKGSFNMISGAGNRGLTIEEGIAFLDKKYGERSEHSRDVSNYFCQLQTKGKVLTYKRICDVTLKDGSAFFVNDAWKPEDEDTYRFARAQERLKEIVELHNDLAGTLSEPRVTPVFGLKMPNEKLSELLWAMRNEKDLDLSTAAVTLEEIINSLK